MSLRRAEVERVVREVARRGWGLDVGAARVLKDRWNAVVRVEAGGARWLLRLHTPRYHAPEGIAQELEWLDALAGAGLDAPAPRRTLDGSWVASIDGPFEHRTASMLAWVEGRRAARLGVRTMRRLGALAARLHDHADAYEGPVDARPRWDAARLGRYFFAPRDDRGWRGLDAATTATFRSALDRMADVEAGLPKGAFGLCHADLHHGNLVYAGGGLVPIDFDDCGVACRLYDLAVTLQAAAIDARSERGRAMIEGYREVRALPDAWLAHLDTFLAARLVTVATFVRGWASEDPTFRLDVDAIARDARARVARLTR